jgi:hypothetical protein
VLASSVVDRGFETNQVKPKTIKLAFVDNFDFFQTLGVVIEGTEKLDDNWWRGRIGTQTGIFPTTHVMELELPQSLRESACFECGRSWVRDQSGQTKDHKIGICCISAKHTALRR